MTTGGHNDEPQLATASTAGSVQNGGQDAQHGALDGAGNSQARAGCGRLDLQAFCQVGDWRGYLNNPFPVGLFAAATNGHVMALHSAECAADHWLKYADTLPETLPPSLLRYAHDVAHGQFTPLSAIIGSIEQVEPEQCSECKGTGKSVRSTCPECDGVGELELESDYNYYEVECKMCYGKGHVKHRKVDGDPGACKECSGAGKRYTKNRRTHVIDADIQPQYFDLIKNLDGVEVCTLPAGATPEHGCNVGFRQVIDGKVESIGLIMGMRK